MAKTERIKAMGAKSKVECESKHDQLGFRAFSADTKLSPLRKYQLLCTGNTSLWSLAKYETLMLLVNDLPGLLGMALRRVLYRRLFGKMGRGVVLGRGLVLRQPSRIGIGDNVVVDDRCTLSVRGSGESRIQIGNGVFIGRDTILNVREGVLEIREYANLSSSVRVGSMGHVVIGEYSLVSAFCYLGAPNHKMDRVDIPIAMQGAETKGGSIIENDVWLGAGVTVSDGVRIGTGSVIGAGSVVTKDIPPYSIAYGVPAKVARNRKD